MKNLFLFLLIITQQVFSQELYFQKVPIDSTFSFRGLSVVNDSVVWVAGMNGRVGKSTNGGNSWNFQQVKGFEKSDFRTLYAFNSQEAIIANAGAPAYILRTNDGGKNWNVVYTNTDSLAFFDGIDFWNNKEGIIYGDPIKGRMLLLRTKNRGHSWQELPEQSRPQVAVGEASFAASGTGIRCFGNKKVVIATGAKVSRLLISTDKGQSWEPVQTPIIQGESGTGIFSFAFINDTTGIIVGGDYIKPEVKTNHVFYTINAGKSWTFPAAATGGYRECVEFITDKIAIAVGPRGSDISHNAGKEWKPMNEKSFHVIRKARKGTLVIAAGHKKISILKTK